MTERINPRNGVHAAAAAAVGALLLGAVACTTDLPTAEAVESMDVSAAQQQAEVAGLVALRSDGREPLYVIDGVIVDPATARALAPTDIASIEVVKGEAARRTMGEKATAGAVYVATVTGLPRKTAEQENSVQADPERLRRQQVERQALMKAAVREPGSGSAAPLIVVDGKPSKDGMQSIERASIERVEVVKGEAAKRRFDDPRAAHGVILITTKKGGHEDG